MQHILLTGAGFSRNWGGWLADEAFEYLLGCKELDSSLRELLWNHHAQGGGFEGALSHLQSEYANRRDMVSEQRLARFESAIGQMFSDMNEGFSTVNFQLNYRGPEYWVSNYLKRFDAIFTLN